MARVVHNTTRECKTRDSITMAAHNGHKTVRRNMAHNTIRVSNTSREVIADNSDKAVRNTEMAEGSTARIGVNKDNAETNTDNVIIPDKARVSASNTATSDREVTASTNHITNMEGEKVQVLILTREIGLENVADTTHTKASAGMETAEADKVIMVSREMEITEPGHTARVSMVKVTEAGAMVKEKEKTGDKAAAVKIHTGQTTAILKMIIITEAAAHAAEDAELISEAA